VINIKEIVGLQLKANILICDSMLEKKHSKEEIGRKEYRRIKEVISKHLGANASWNDLSEGFTGIKIITKELED